jgi:hypothetical protein
VLLSQWVDKLARGKPIKRGDPRYFMVPDGEEEKKDQ